MLSYGAEKSGFVIVPLEAAFQSWRKCVPGVNISLTNQATSFVPIVVNRRPGKRSYTSWTPCWISSVCFQTRKASSRSFSFTSHLLYVIVFFTESPDALVTAGRNVLSVLFEAMIVSAVAATFQENNIHEVGYAWLTARTQKTVVSVSCVRQLRMLCGACTYEVLDASISIQSADCDTMLCPQIASSLKSAH